MNEFRGSKLMVDKLKLQLLLRVRAEFGVSSEQLAGQSTFIHEGLRGHRAACA